jgi:hypothetical protein
MTGRAIREELEAREGPSGFPLQFHACPNTLHQVLDELGFEALQSVSLECGGRVNQGHFQGFVTRWKGTAVEDDRRSVSAWLKRHASVVDFDLGQLVRY